MSDNIVSLGPHLRQMIRNPRLVDSLCDDLSVLVAPSAELDIQVARVAGWQVVAHPGAHEVWVPPPTLPHIPSFSAPGPRLTGSFDDARTLLLPGWGISLHDPNPGQMRPVVALAGALDPRSMEPVHGLSAIGTARLLACAMCIAALRAMQAEIARVA